LDKAIVSVVVPAFNAEAHLGKTLSSALAQTYREIELIVVDDGSLDATSAVVQEFAAKDARVRLIRQSNAGVGAARNAAIRLARGKYIAPLDADDLWAPEKLEKQVARMEQSGDEIGLVYCWSRLIDSHGNLVELSHPFTLEGRLRHVMVLRNLVGNASVPLFRAATLEKVGLYLSRAEQAGAQGCEDWDLALRIAEKFTIGVVPEYLVAYIQNDSSMSLNAENMARSFGVVMGRARQRNRDLPSASFRWSHGYFDLYIAEKCYDWAYYLRCIHYLKEAALANPVLLWRVGMYKFFVKSLLNIVRGTATPQIPGQARSLRKSAGGAALPAKRERKRPFFLNVVFRHFELTRWSAAMNDRG